jgi:pimeloyl-ACP methyl ester carboxylesterase
VRAWALMGINVFLGLRFGVWGEGCRSVVREAARLVAHGMAGKQAAGRHRKKVPQSTRRGWHDRLWNAAGWWMGCRFRARLCGRRAARLPVVCLHGLTRNSRDFEKLAPWLAARAARAGAGHARAGQSDRDPQARYDIATYVGDVTALLDALGWAGVFVGTSMGGLITVELATRIRPGGGRGDQRHRAAAFTRAGASRAMSARRSRCPTGRRRPMPAPRSTPMCSPLWRGRLDGHGAPPVPREAARSSPIMIPPSPRR